MIENTTTNIPATPPEKTPIVGNAPPLEAASLPQDRLWVTDEVAHYLQVSPKTIFNQRRQGLPCVLVGGAVRFDPQAVKNYLTSNPRLSLHRRRQIVRKGGKV